MRESVLDRLKDTILGADIDTLLVSHNANIRYVTGFTGEAAYAAVNRAGASLFVNSLYIEHARATVPSSVEIREIREGVFETFASMGESFWGKRVGLEGNAVVCAFYEKFREAVKPGETVMTEGIVEEFREQKEPSEIEAMTRAQRLAEMVLRDALTIVKEGVEERDIAIEIDYRMRRAGAERPAFDTIVASGPNTSKPHAVPTARKIKSGDFVLIDMGAVVDGYASDMTRTVVLGKADKRRREVYYTVLDAQRAALEGIAAGIKCSDADRMARDVIEKAGYGKEFVHSLGHGVGLEVHENPRLSARSDALLKPGAVVTVEPGIYIPDWGGVRIEDMAVATDNGCMNLTEAPKELLEL